MAQTDKAKLKKLAARPRKIAANAKVEALFDLVDRISALAMRRGGFDFETARLHGEFAAWGEFAGRLKVATDAARSGKAIEIPEPPPLPETIDDDLQHAVRHFAGLAGLLDQAAG